MTTEAKKAAIIGGGVIGGGWAARFLLNGWDVAVHDPDPDARRKIEAVLDNARRSLPALHDRALPPEGRLTFGADLAETVAGADWVQESVPERIELKRRTFAAIQAAARPDAVIGSSTSGFKPSELQEGAARPEAILVCHPFNPVYLLPLVELVPSAATDPATTARAERILTELGMKPLTVAREIDAHVADRLLEAVWREGLWLIKDGICTTEQLDDAIRFGFGLRWAQMGLFETYRIAGGEAGMRHFLAQFGPALKWPWTKLMDVPELDEALVETIARQSDEQAAGRSIRELERIRDDNLVGMMRALKRTDWGAGGVLNAHDRRLAAPDAEALPPETLRRAIPQGWTDYNGHMNEARYLDLFCQATDRFMEMVGADADYVASGMSYFTVETHIRHLDEVRAGEQVRATTQLLDGTGKRMRLFHRLETQDGRLAATGEHMLIHVSLATRAACPPGPEVAARLAETAARHAALPPPEGAGRGVGQPR